MQSGTNSNITRAKRQATPVLWLCGPPGVGKSTVGWEIYQRLATDGMACAYVDIDQLGICYPEQCSDPGRYRLKERNLGAVMAKFARNGACGLIVSGVVDPVSGVDLAALPGLEVTLCRLRAGPVALRLRLLSRSGSLARIEDAVDEALALDCSHHGEAIVDTTDLTVEQTARRVMEASGWAPAAERHQAVAQQQAQRPSWADGRVLWLCGPAGVGKSTIGFALCQRLLQAGLMAGYVDADQVGFYPVASDGHELKAANLAAVWENYRSVGAEALVVAGPVRDRYDARVYENGLPRASFSWFRLHAGPNELTRRVQTRRQGGSWPQPGDPLRGASSDQLQKAVADSKSQAAELEVVGTGTRVDTTMLSIAASASVILRSERLSHEVAGCPSKQGPTRSLPGPP